MQSSPGTCRTIQNPTPYKPTESILAAMHFDAHHLDARDIERRRDRAAASFDSADFLHQRAHEGLSERLEPMVMNPSLIVDLGAGTGAMSRRLAKQYRRARVLSVDPSRAMLDVARRARPFLSRTREVRAETDRLPLPDGSVDLVYSNLWLAWVDDLAGCFNEIARVLKKGGVFAFATLGPDTLSTLRDARFGDIAVRQFVDMHDVGDLLVRAGLAEPVLDVDKLTVTYRRANDLFRDLTAVGARNLLRGRQRGLMGKTRFARLTDALTADDGLAIELELVYGHAWGSGPRAARGEVRIDPAAIGRLRPGDRGG